MGLLYSTEDFHVYGCVAPLSWHVYFQTVLSHAGGDLTAQFTDLAGT